jgi:hypothetical protein
VKIVFDDLFHLRDSAQCFRRYRPDLYWCDFDGPINLFDGVLAGAAASHESFAEFNPDEKRARIAQYVVGFSVPDET